MSRRNLKAYVGAVVVPTYLNGHAKGIVKNCTVGPYGPVAQVAYGDQNICESLHLLTIVGWTNKTIESKENNND